MLHTYTSVDKKVAERQRLASEFSSREAGLSRRRVKQKSTHKYKVYIMLARLRGRGRAGRGRAGRGRAGRGKAVVGDGKLSTSLSLSLSLSHIHHCYLAKFPSPGGEFLHPYSPPPTLGFVRNRKPRKPSSDDPRFPSSSRKARRRGGPNSHRDPWPHYCAEDGRLLSF